MYDYSSQDPVNNVDPSGTIVLDLSGITTSSAFQNNPAAVILLAQLDRSSHVFTIKKNPKIYEAQNISDPLNPGGTLIELGPNYSSNELARVLYHELFEAQTMSHPMAVKAEENAFGQRNPSCGPITGQ